MRYEVFRNSEGGRPLPDPIPDLIECWGGGGKGGVDVNGEGGGAGGDYAAIQTAGREDLAPGTLMDIHIGHTVNPGGAPGSFVKITGGVTIVQAANGKSAQGRTGGAVGDLATSFGDTVSAGGAGGSSVGPNAGGAGGGSSAGPEGPGNAGQSNSGATGGAGGEAVFANSPGASGGNSGEDAESIPGGGADGNYGGGGGGGGKGGNRGTTPYGAVRYGYND